MMRGGFELNTQSIAGQNLNSLKLKLHKPVVVFNSRSDDVTRVNKLPHGFAQIIRLLNTQQNF